MGRGRGAVTRNLILVSSSFSYYKLLLMSISGIFYYLFCFSQPRVIISSKILLYYDLFGGVILGYLGGVPRVSASYM